MNGIGITAWQNNVTEYPLKGAGVFSGLFCDASFVTFDNFIPVLNTINIVDGSIILNLTFDDGSRSFIFNSTSIVPGSSIRLKTDKRSYGTLVFGRIITNVLSGTLGSLLNISCKFDPNVVRSIDSTNGVYNINGLSGDVRIALDKNLIYESTIFGAPALSAVSNPSNLTTLTTKSIPHIYTSNRLLQSINTNTVTDLMVLDKFYSHIFDHDSHLIGALTTNNITTIYDLSVLPSPKLLDGISGTITGLTKLDGNLWAMIDDKLYNLGEHPYSNSTGIQTGLTKTKGLVYFNGKFYTSTKGPIDYSTQPTTNFSSLIYSIEVVDGVATSTELGMLNDPNILNTEEAPDLSKHVPELCGLYTFNNELFGWGVMGDQLYIFQISNTLDVTTSFSTQYVGIIASVFIGGPSIVLNSVVPLKYINGVETSSKQIGIVGSDTISIVQTSNDTLTFNLPIADQYLNVSRSTVYE